MINREQLKELAKSDLGEVLVDYLAEKIKEMNDITTIKGTVEEKGKITEARQLAAKILKELFSFLEKAREKRPETKKTDYL